MKYAALETMETKIDIDGPSMISRAVELLATIIILKITKLIKKNIMMPKATTINKTIRIQAN